MKQFESRGRLGDAEPGGTRGLRRIVVMAGLAVVGLVLVLAAIYVGVFVILAPMMQ
ncbi:hypothetical protein AB4Z42_04670 [Mycobacterium sp. 2YAF39]|uniref:hypothetical protein n=1 Tax=Mycobacterium sp. 2YAF39 TaxID=3233033 RepID=UPI003F98EC27